MHEKICIYCKEKYTARNKNSKKCKKRECYNAEGRKSYKGTQKLVNCVDCNLEIYVDGNKTLCNNCRNKRKKEGLKTKIISVCCIRCKKTIREEERKITKTETKVFKSLCLECKKESGELKSISKRGELNPNWNGGRKNHKRKKKFETKEEMKIAFSNRMKESNPMFNEEVKKKSIETRNNKIKNGLLIYKRGKEHHLYKGTREPKREIVKYLSDWRKQILKEANFTCNECKHRGGKLEIHHLEPFREIIDKFISSKELKKLSIESNEFFNLKDKIIQYHFDNNQIAEVLCEKCHIEKDEYRKQFIKRA